MDRHLHRRLPDQVIRETTAQVVRLHPTTDDLTALADEWISEYANARTRERHHDGFRLMLRGTGATTLQDITAGAVAAWIGSGNYANNTARSYITTAKLFLAWCAETGHTAGFRERPFKNLLHSYPPTYGKVQGEKPANRLDQAGYQRLIAACQDGTHAGMRDELLVRLAVSGGMRATELLNLTVGNVAHGATITWTGKARKVRTARMGDALQQLVARYLHTYANGLSRPITDADRLFCPSRNNHDTTPAWGTPMASTPTIRWMLRRRAAAAGLGHLAPHDLKRSAARMMHEARSADGGHLFDLLDIADVLDHSNPKVTKDCYIGPLGNANKDRAASLFD